jgi:hypothetical protein
VHWYFVQRQYCVIHTFVWVTSQFRNHIHCYNTHLLQHSIKPEIRLLREIKICIFRDIKPCSPSKVNDVLKATSSSENLVDFQRTTKRYIRKERTLHKYICENLGSCIFRNIRFPFLLNSLPHTKWYKFQNQPTVACSIHISLKYSTFWYNHTIKSVKKEKLQKIKLKTNTFVCVYLHDI